MGENYFGITDPGKERKNNEDRFIAEPIFEGDHIVACVIDGVGGYAGGDVAAQLTSDAILEHFNKRAGALTTGMVAALQDANDRIVHEKGVNPQNENMACVVTLAVVDIEKNIFYYAHVGDTRLYLFRDGSLVKITKDHSNVGFLEESGRLSESAAMQHPKRNEVNKALGYETGRLANDFIDTGESPFLPGDTILICSDGLTDMVSSNKVVSILEGADDLTVKGKLLVDAANDAGGKDNVTVVLVRNDKAPAEHSLARPVIVQKSTGQQNTTALPGADKKTGDNDDLAIQKAKGNNGVIAVLVILCILVIAIYTWKFYGDLVASRRLAKTVQPVTTKKPKNDTEQKLSDSINASLQNRTVTLVAGTPIVLTDSLLINNDTLHIIGNGVSIKSDTSFIGAAFVIGASCKYILLDSLSIENFDVGVLLINKGLHLRKVNFKNCRLPVQYKYHFPQGIAEYGLQVETVYTTDSLHK